MHGGEALLSQYIRILRVNYMKNLSTVPVIATSTLSTNSLVLNVPEFLLENNVNFSIYKSSHACN